MAGAAVDELRQAADARGDGRNAAGHAFKGREAEGFEFAGKHEQVGEGKDFRDAALFAEEVNAVVDAFAVGHPLAGRAVGAVADHEQPRGNFASDAREDADDVGGAFDGAEIGEVDEDFLAGLGIAGAAGGAIGFAEGSVDIAVDEVGDDFNGAVGMEFLDGGFAQVIGDGGDAVALIDTEAGNGQVGMVEADEGDVGSVERGDEGQAVILALEHFAREVGGDGVGNGVVDVEDVELVVGGDFRHARGEGQIVGRVFEEGVVGDGDLVKGDLLFASAEAKGLGIGDEMHLMPGRGQLDAEFGGDDSAASVGGITGDANLHKVSEERVPA